MKVDVTVRERGEGERDRGIEREERRETERKRERGERERGRGVVEAQNTARRRKSFYSKSFWNEI